MAEAWRIAIFVTASFLVLVACERSVEESAEPAASVASIVFGAESEIEIGVNL